MTCKSFRGSEPRGKAQGGGFQGGKKGEEAFGKIRGR